MSNAPKAAQSSVKKLATWWPRLFFVALALMLADLLVLWVRPMMIAEPIRLGQGGQVATHSTFQSSQFQSVINRNIFSKDGVIPETLFAKSSGGGSKDGSEAVSDDKPVPSTLPITLIGTIVHSDPQKSIANVEIKSKSIALAVRVGNTIDTLARLEAVERGKIIFRNLNNNRLEFLEIKEVNRLAFNSSKGAAPTESAEINQVAPNVFEVKREDVLKYTANLSNVLQQAAMVPVRGPGGEITGFRFVNIQPDSIYTKLGFQVGDVIRSVNGQPIDSPAKALELYNALKGDTQIRMNVERNGRPQDMEYQVR